MIYILYECNKTNTITLSKQLFINQMILNSGLQIEQTRLAKAQNKGLSALCWALCESLKKENIDEDIQSTIKKEMVNLMKPGILYASANHIKKDEELSYLICLGNQMPKLDEGIQFIIYRSDMDEAIVCTRQEEMMLVYLNLERLKDDCILTKFAQGIDDLMVKEPSIQLLDRVCALHPLFHETIPHLLLFLCNATQTEIKVHKVQDKEPMFS